MRPPACWKSSTYKDVKLDDAGTAEPLFALARDVAAAEDKRAVDFQERGDTGGGVQDFSHENSNPAERRGRRNVSAASRAHPAHGSSQRLESVKPSLPEETQKKADAVLAALDTAIASAASKDTVELNLTVAVRNMAEAIGKAVPSREARRR